MIARVALIIVLFVVRLQAPGFVDSMFAGFNIGAPPLVNYGTPAMKATILPEVLAGRKRVALAITEAFAGSDVAGHTPSIPIVTH